MSPSVSLHHVVVALSGALLLCRVPFSFAESVGSPASILKKGQWVMGLAGGGTKGREMNGEAETHITHGGHYRGYGLSDRVSVYLKLGAAFIEIDDPAIKKTNDLDPRNSFGTNFMTGLALKTKLFESVAHRWEWDGSLHYLDLRQRHKSKNELRWHEWQFATSVAKEIGRVKPYIGIKYAVVNALYRVRQDGKPLKDGRYKEKTRVGLFVGTDCYLGESEDVILNIESAYQDGPEVTVSLAYTF
jgi:hypothetical protein